MYSNELYHHGIKGMKRGIRRYQNKDGSLTAKGKAMASKKYKKYMNRANQEVNTTENYVKAYNRAADKMNNGLIDKYNRDYDKKLGAKAKDHDFLNDKEYENGYNKLFESVLSKEYDSVMTEAYKSNRNYKKAQALADKYNMESFDDIVRQNNAAIKAGKKYIG